MTTGSIEIERRPFPTLGAPPRESAESIVGEGILRGLEAPFLRLEALVARGVPERLNPLAQPGAVANTSLLVAVATGILLLFTYTPSLAGAHDSMVAMDRAPYTTGLVRSLHRYSSDVALFFVLLHALRSLLSRRVGGARWIAWVTGLAGTAFVWLIGWLGYWLVWDERARQVAVGTARLVDVIPVFSDPLSRSFLVNANVNSLLFFVVFFAHVLLPLALVLVLWLHVVRLSRPRFLAGRALTAWLVGAMTVMSLVHPATTAAPARMDVHPAGFTMDWWYLLPVALTDRLGAGAAWSVLLVGGAIVLSAPWWLVRRTAAPAEVELSLCNACNKCSADCPYGAITMVPRTDGRRHATQAQVEPDKCVGCGICTGSCDSAGVGIPWPAVVDERHRIDRWLTLAAIEGEPPLVVLACVESGGGSLGADPETGLAPDLPGCRVMTFPCAGWIHPLTVERALRRGARGVLVVSCRPGSCRHREGAQWTAQRMAGEREPALRTGKVDASRVRVLHLDRPEKASVLRAIRGAGASGRAPSRALATLAAGLVLVTAGVLVVGGSDFAYAAPARPGAELVVSFKHPGRVAENCRDLTEEEKESLPVHMQARKVCRRERLPVRLRIEIDGVLARQLDLAAKGLWKDGPSIALETIPVEPGEHVVVVAVDDGPDRNAWAHRSEQRIAFRSSERRVVLFDRADGFTWH